MLALHDGRDEALNGENELVDLATGVFGVVGAAIGGALALGAQAVATGGARRTAKAQLEQERWKTWQLSGSATWSRAAVMVHRVGSAPADLAAVPPARREELRSEAMAIARDLYQLSAASVDRHLSQWADNVARTFAVIGDAIDALERENGVAEANRLFTEVRAALTTQIEWNDGTSLTTLERLREMLLRSAPQLLQ